MKKALITGATGQDGSYLTELLLAKGYQVHGIIRRASTFNTGRINHIYTDPHDPKARLFLHFGDLSDAEQTNNIIFNIKPDEVYHLAAQSHVRVSFDIPEYTGDVTGLGTVRILEAIRRSGRKIKFYQASSSEMFGSATPPQSENTRFQPQSPYACAKLYSYWFTKNYRDGYNMFACNGILFNHETVASFMPMFCKKAGEEEFDIKPIAEIVPFDKSIKQYQSRDIFGICVWGKDGWVEVRHASAYPHNIADGNKKPRFINSRSGAFMATSSHVGFIEGGGEKEVGNMAVGDCLEVIDLPDRNPTLHGVRRITEKEAELLGMMVGDGSVTPEKRGTGIHGKFTNSSSEIRGHFDYLWSAVTGGHTKYYPTQSGFNPSKTVDQLRLNGGNEWLRGIDIYNEDRTKRVPRIILNSEMSVMLAFLRGYNATDGLKSNLCTYEFKNFKTNSATLAMGLWYLIEKTTKQDINLTVETKEDGRVFYSLNLLSTIDNFSKECEVKELALKGVSQREMSRLTGISRTFIRKIQDGGSACLEHPFHKNPFEIKKIVEMPNYQGWFCDLETSSGEFHCGIGKIHVHNSPRRGETFVSRKITRAIANILAGRQEELYLGNLKAKRDWGYAPEYVQMMWLILQQDNPDDYVIGTGESHSVKELVEEAFGYAGLKWKRYVRIDPRYFRPTEVNNLIADIKRVKKVFKWQPRVGFHDLVKIMLDADMRACGLEPIGEGDKIIRKKFPRRWWKAD